MGGEQVRHRGAGPECGGEEERVERLGGAQVLGWDAGDVAADLGQCRGQGGWLGGQHGRGPVDGRLAVAGQGPDEKEADGVDEGRDGRHGQEDGGGVLVPLAAPAEQLGAVGEADDQPGDDAQERDGDHRHVAVGDVGEFVGEDAFEFLGLQTAHETGGHADHGVVGVDAGGKGVGQVHVGDRDPRLGHVRARAQPVHDPVQPRLLLGRDEPAAHGVQGDAVGVPVLGAQQGRGDDDYEDDGLEQHDQRGDERHVEQSEQEHGDRRAGGQLSVGLESAAHRHHPVSLGSGPRRTATRVPAAGWSSRRAAPDPME
ncbi:hypothetical protein SUDANB105_00015 [Streptomyces sp. enrichment culture]